MAIENIFKQRKYPFILALSVLLVTVTVFVLTTTSNPVSSVFFNQQQSSPNTTVSHPATTTTTTTPSPAQNNNTDDNNNKNNTPSPIQNENANSSSSDNNENNSSTSDKNNNSNVDGSDSNNNNDTTNTGVDGSDSNNNNDTNTTSVDGSDSNNNNDTNTTSVDGSDSENNNDTNTTGVDGSDSENNNDTNTTSVDGSDSENNNDTNNTSVDGSDSNNNTGVDGSDSENNNDTNTTGVDGSDSENNNDTNTTSVDGSDSENNNDTTNTSVDGSDSNNNNDTNNNVDGSDSNNNNDTNNTNVDGSDSNNNNDTNNTNVDGSDSNNNNDTNNTKVDESDSNNSDNNDNSSSDNNNTTSVVGSDSNNNNTVAWSDSDTDPIKWEVCKLPMAADYIPCLDNNEAIKKLPSRAHMEHRERHCPNPPPRCLVPLPDGYNLPIPWPKSRDMILYNNVPHPKLVEYKKEQNWVRKSGEYFVFPGGGTQFTKGVNRYLDFIQRTFPPIIWGKSTRVVLDIGCGVASFGGYLLDKNVITMSLAPKDEHEAQIQFALERGIPAILSVIGTQKLPFPDDTYDLIHCARCRVHWDADGGKPLLELNRILRPGGFFVWSATPVYKKDQRHKATWQSMNNLTASICWKAVARAVDSSKIGLVIYQKPISYSCYKRRKVNDPPLCDAKSTFNSSWYAPLMSCVTELPLDRQDNVARWPKPWPERLQLPGVTNERRAVEALDDSTKYWSGIVSSLYLEGLSVNWSRVRNVMDMNATFGGFAAALIDKPLWVMNVIPIEAQDTLPTIFDRGLIGIYHDWCESFNTYPRTYDLLHSSYLLTSVAQRCDIKDVVVEIDRILRPDGYLVVQDTMETINKISPILRSLHWSLKLYQNQFLVGIKGFWRPSTDNNNNP